MAKNALATIGILTVLLLSLGLVSAAVSQNSVSISLDQTSISDVVEGTAYTIVATIENLNGTDFYVSFRTTGWDSWDADATVMNGTSESFTGVFIASSAGSKGVYVDVYNASNITQKLFEISRTITLNHLNTLSEGCKTVGDGNYTDADVHNEDYCIGIPPEPTTEDFEFCNWNGTTGFTNGTDLRIKGFTDEQLDNDDEWEWKPLDEIEIEVDVENNGEDDEDYIVEIIFLDSNGKEVDIAEDDKNLEEEVSIDEGDSETVIFNFVVDGDVDDGNNYYMHIKVYQEGDEDEQCVSVISDEVERIEIIKERHDVLVKKVEGPNTVEAGSQVLYEVRVANLGREDQDLVKVIVSNSELGILMTREIENLDEGDSEVLTFSVEFPEEAEEKLYKIRFSTEFDYDEDDEIYDKNSDSGDDILYQVTVLGGENIKPTISASLESEAKVGEELVIIATIINNGEDDNFDITVTGYESWAELVSVSPQSLSLDEDEEGTVVITLIPINEGVQTFKVNAFFNGESHDQAVSVSITEDEKGLFADVSKTVLYSVAGIAGLIILIFLTLIVKVSRRAKKVPQF